MHLDLHPEARAELRSAALWYDERRTGLGDEFIVEVSAALDRIGDGPESYPAWPGTRTAGPLIRKATIQRFPYVIAFEKHEHHLLVLAVAHVKRRPLTGSLARSLERNPAHEARLRVELPHPQHDAVPTGAGLVHHPSLCSDWRP